MFSWAAIAPTLTASARPLSPFTTTILDIDFSLSSFSANFKEVSYLLFPDILSKFIFSAFNCFSISELNAIEPPIKYTFFTPSLFNSAFVLLSNLLLWVNNIGASFALANGVADKASAIELSFTKTALSDFVHPAWLIFIAVSHLPEPVNVSFVDALDVFPYNVTVKNVIVNKDTIFFDIFINSYLLILS